jgi:hypothetical protein
LGKDGLRGRERQILRRSLAEKAITILEKLNCYILLKGDKEVKPYLCKLRGTPLEQSAEFMVQPGQQYLFTSDLSTVQRDYPHE